MKGNWALGIGSVIGSCVIFPLGLYVVNIFTIHKNDPKQGLGNYMQHSVNVRCTLPSDIRGHAKDITLQYTRNGDRTSAMTEEIFYLSSYQKYFVYMRFDAGYLNNDEPLGGKEVMMRVNTTDLADPALGSSVKPVPVFNIWEAIPLLMKNDQTGGIDTLYPHFNQKQYEYNVSMYLRYIMPQGEFNRRFQ